MKKSLIAFAALATIAGAASAQSSVTLYGRIDLALGKAVGTDQKALNNGSGSRFGVRGVEDLGGGMSAFFNLEHRYNADTGAASSATRFWTGRSIVGLQGGFGKVTLGREYTTAFLGSQLIADPWGWDTAVSGTPGVGLNQLITGGSIVRVRNDSSITYNFSAAGFSFGAQIAEATDSIDTLQKRPFNFSVGYSAGPLTLAMGYDKTGVVAEKAAKWTTFNGSFDLGAVKLGAFYGKGNTAGTSVLGSSDEHKAYMFTAVAPMGQGEFRASYGRLKSDAFATAAAKGFGLGYHYALSKRTTLYTDYVRNTGFLAGTEKNGYDFGIKHNF